MTTDDREAEPQDAAESRASARRAEVLARAEARLVSEREAAERARAEAAERGEDPPPQAKAARRLMSPPPLPWRR